MSDYTDFLAMVSTEFHKYVMEDEEVAQNIPPNALIIFQVEGEEAWNTWHEEVSLRNREAGQPILYVHVKTWRKHSSIGEIRLAAVS